MRYAAKQRKSSLQLCIVSYNQQHGCGTAFMAEQLAPRFVVSNGQRTSRLSLVGELIPGTDCRKRAEVELIQSGFEGRAIPM